MSPRALTASLLLVLVVGAGAVLWRAAAQRPIDAPAAGAPAETDDARGTASPAGPTSARSAVPAPERAPSETTAAPEAQATWTVHGRVLDPAGGELPGVPVWLDGERLGVTDEAGEFLVQVPPSPRTRTLVARGDGFGALRESPLSEQDRTREHLLVAARAFDLGGLVADANGAPIAGATISLHADSGVWSGFPLPLDTTSVARHAARTDERGRFTMRETPCPAGAMLRAEREGFAPGQTQAPAHARDDLYLVLTAAPPVPQITGWVLLPDRTPAAGARVRCGSEVATADASGAFALDLPRDDDAELPLVAGLAGYASAFVPSFGARIRAARPAPPPPVTLVLGGQPLSISGHVVDAQGAPLAGWVVALTDGTSASRFTMPRVLVEGFGEGGARTTTADDGSFEITDVQDRTYVLRAHENGTLRSVLSGPVVAGATDVVLRLSEGATWPRVRGTVVSRRGAPLAGVSVIPAMITDEQPWGSAWESGRPVVTDEDGAFVIADFPRERVHLDVAGEEVVPERFRPGPSDDLDALRLVVAQRCHFRIAVTGNDPGPMFARIVDAAGKQLQIYRFQATAWSSSDSIGLDLGRSVVCAVSEDAVEVRLFRNEAPEEPFVRQELVLVPGAVNEVLVRVP